MVTRLPLPSRSPLRLARDAAGESEEVCASRVKSLGLRPAVWGGLLAPPPLSSRVDVWTCGGELRLAHTFSLLGVWD